MTIIRRPWLVEPGTSLLLADTSLTAPQRLQEFSTFSGIAPQSLLITPLCSVPLPLYNFRAANPDARRWAGTKPSAMWHPLLWLPNRVAGRYTYPDPATGEKTRESDDVWTIRACLELTASGLYDIETGTWVDILATVGIDASDEFDQGRIQEWLDGSPDGDLDSIDLSEYMTIEPHDWALADALELLVPAVESSWALTADEMFSEIQTMLDPAAEVPHDAKIAVLSAICATGMVLLRDVPQYTTGGESTAPTSEPHGDFFHRAYQAIQGEQVDPATLAAVLEATGDRCYTLREAYWSTLEALHAPFVEA